MKAYNKQGLFCEYFKQMPYSFFLQMFTRKPCVFSTALVYLSRECYEFSYIIICFIVSCNYISETYFLKCSFSVKKKNHHSSPIPKNTLTILNLFCGVLFLFVPFLFFLFLINSVPWSSLFTLINGFYSNLVSLPFFFFVVSFHYYTIDYFLLCFTTHLVTVQALHMQW